MTDFTERSQGGRQPAIHRQFHAQLATLDARFKRVRLFLCDVDGVLTDGTVLVGEGFEAKSFNIQDGLGLSLLRRGGLKIGWISNRTSPATATRAAELKVDFLHQDKTSKVAAIEAILQPAGASWDEVCYVGDDVVDLGALKRAGVAVAVANAVAEAKAVAHLVTAATGGHGAVREVAEMILKAQGRWDELLAAFAD
jgi:3-deoxy-D-manno-octulosonate 8-phosphate phosphatase (KDO 8-P phosphatase)